MTDIVYYRIPILWLKQITMKLIIWDTTFCIFGYHLFGYYLKL